VLLLAALSGSISASACTSIALSNCYADVNTGSGYVLCGTYLSLDACAADSNGLYGYQILGGKAIAFHRLLVPRRMGEVLSTAQALMASTFVSCRGHV